jgi:hypothetical protein
MFTSLAVFMLWKMVSILRKKTEKLAERELEALGFSLNDEVSEEEKKKLAEEAAKSQDGETSKQAPLAVSLLHN